MPFLVLLLMLLTSCSTPVVSSGGGATDTGNAFVVGIVSNTPGSNVASREIVIAPVDADPLSEDSVLFVRCTTNVDGSFQSPNIAKGDYILYNREGVDGLLYKVTVDMDEENSIGEIQIKGTGSLLISPSQFGDVLPDVVFIPGTPIVVGKNAEGQFLLDSIPASIVPLIQAKYSDGTVEDIAVNREFNENEHLVLAGDLSVLFLVQGDTANLSQSVIDERSLLASYGFEVITQDFAAVTPDMMTLSGYDLIYGCNELLWDSNGDQWRSLPIPIATSSVNGYEVLAMTDTVAGSHGTRLESTLLTDLTGYHPAFLGTGWSSSFTVVPVESGVSTWGIPTSGATIFLKGSASQVEKFLFVYREGTDMYHTTVAPAGRIAIYTGDSKANSSAFTQSIILRALFWGMNLL